MSEGPENLGSPEWKFSNKEKLGSTFKNLNSPGSSQQPQLPGNGAVCCQARKKNLLLNLSLFPQARAKNEVYSVPRDSDNAEFQQYRCFQPDFMCLTFVVNGALKFYHLP